MPYDDSVPPTRRARPLLVATALAALCLTAVAGCGGAQDPAGTDTDAAKPGPEAEATASASASASTPSPEASPTGAQPSGATPTAPLPQGPLTGRTVVIDPGHNPRNREHTKEINQQVDIGTGRKECDTTGTSTNAGYAEARFTLDVSHRLRELLQAQGARGGGGGGRPPPPGGGRPPRGGGGGGRAGR
ncbi:hypothetical protein ACWFQE_05410, partial [Streptomyces bacillaris]